ncbi:MAG TPA: aspartyl protease family protein [Sphingomicrobium sp.]|nr:aspartyl protease family protein [Sphingomicrobium sp.]
MKTAFRWVGATLLLSSSWLGARDLTPEVRARLLAPTATVQLGRAAVTIPMRGTDRQGYYKCPYFQVYVNKKGPFTFVFDTGASYTVVSSRVVAAANTPVAFDRNGDRDVVEISDLSVGGVQLKDLWAIHDDAFGVDGVLGFRAFGKANLLFDLKARQLLVSHAAIRLPRSFELAFDAPHNIPRVPVRIGSRLVPILIDTGDDAYGLELRPDDLGDAATEHPPAAAGSVLNGAKVQSTQVTILRDPIGLGPTRADHAVIGVNADLPESDFGYDVLRQFRFVIDPPAQVVRFQPRFRGDLFVVPPTLSAGFTMQFDGSGRVKDVVSNSEADRAGLRLGDQIVAVAGIASKSLTPRSWDRLLVPSHDLDISWIHAGQPKSGRWKVRSVS